MNKSVIASILGFALFSSSLLHAEECIPVYKHRIVSSASHERWLNDEFYHVLTAMKPLYLYLDLEVAEAQLEDLARGPDELGRLYFFAGGDEGAAEYLIHPPRSGKAGPKLTGNRITGYFVMFEIAGPHAGIMSVNLRPFSPSLRRCEQSALHEDSQ